MKKEDSKKLEKANALFAGIGGGSKDKKDDSSDSDSDKKKKKKDKKKDEAEKVSGDLLALDGGDSKKTTAPTSNNMMDLLDFDAKPAPVTSTPITQDLLGDILGGGTQPAKPKIVF